MRRCLQQTVRLVVFACLVSATDGAWAHPASGIVVDAEGNVYFVHSGRGVGKIDAKGALTYVHKSTGGHFLAEDPTGMFSKQYSRLFTQLVTSSGKSRLLFAPGGAPLAVGQDGNLYYGSGFPEGDDLTPGGLTIARLSPAGKRTLFAPALKSHLSKMNEAVTGLAPGPDGTLFVACPNAILKVKLDGTVTTFLHPVVVNDCDDAFGRYSQSPFFHAPYLRGLDVRRDGTIFAAVTGCRRVVKISPAGEVRTVLKSQPPWTPTGVAVRGDEVFVLEYDRIAEPKSWSPRVRKLAANGLVTTLFSSGREIQSANSPASFLGSKAGEQRAVLGIELCWCPAGRFIMGSPRSEPERRSGEDQVEVTLTKGFWTGKFEVTQGDWKRIVGALPGPLTAAGGEGDRMPLYNVNYPEALGFCRTLTEKARAAGELPHGWEFRLPTEAQWEYACRAGTTTATAFGDKISSKQANFQGKPYNGAEPGPSLKHATPVGSYPPNAWGLHDMHGNVVEWCRDWFHARLPGGRDPDLSTALGTKNRTGDYSRSRRGSAWTDDGWASRSAFRQRFEPLRRYDHIGFRVVAVQL